ncbi:hypothetical protein QAD02_011481 [Eretmocerus hayati]|uniref:Uncharacterized protein n=1 Tax=Eretmocerus hayati TaxID=131215 RepID=A0ACC2NWW4_9HYME|nr:hypothetical protein QAD02_011481 [Eretmocerus hayati]
MTFLKIRLGTFDSVRHAIFDTSPGRTNMDATVQSESENITAYRDIAQFCYAVSEHNERALLELLRRGYDVNATIGPDNPFEGFSKKITGLSALQYASQVESVQSIRVLLDSGADFTLKNLCGSTVLQACVESLGSSLSKIMDYISEGDDVAQLILSAHVKNNVTVNSVNKHGLSHFHIACLVGHEKAMQLFLDSGVQVNAPIYEDSPTLPGYTPLHIASRFGSLGSVKLLVSRGADVHARNRDGLVPLQLIFSRLEDFSYLGLYREYCQNNREFHLELQADTYRIAAILIMETLSSDTLTNKLCIACAKRCPISVREIIDKGMDINASTDFGLTALHCASLVDYDVTKLLLERGADFFLQRRNNPMPVDICTWKYGYDIMKLLPSVQNLAKHINQESQSWRIALALHDNENLKDLLSDNEVVQEIKTACISPDSPVWPGATPFHLVIIFARENPRKPEPNSTSYIQSSPQCVKDLVETLIIHGANVTRQDTSGQTPVHTAFYCKKFGVLNMLLNPYMRSFETRHLTSLENPVDNTGLSHFHIACMMGCKSSVGILIDTALVNEPLRSSLLFSLNSSEPEILFKPGSTPLHIAAKLKRIDAIELLAFVSANICAKDADGSTPIDLIVSNADFDESELIELAVFLVHKYCILNSDSELGSVQVSQFGPLCALLDPILFSVRYSYYGGKTCKGRLMMQHMESGVIDEIEKGKLERMKKFFKCLDESKESTSHGSDSNDVVSRYTNCLRRMLENSHKYQVSVRQCFKSYSVLMVDHYKCLSSTLLDDESGLTCLHMTCAIGVKEITEAAIKLGRNVNSRLSSKSPYFPGSTPLHLAIRGCDKESEQEVADGTVKLLLDHGADPTIQDNNGETPLHLADRHGFEEIRDLLLLDERVAKNNLISKYGRSHFHIACSSDQPEVVEKFLQYGADPNELCYAVDNNLWKQLSSEHVPSFFGFTPLHIASKLEVIKVLLKHGANPNIKDYKGWTALHQAARHGFGADVIEILIREGGADVNARSVLHLTPLDLVVTENVEHYGDTSQIRALLEHGALVNRGNFEESSTLARAFESYDVEILQTLVKYATDLGNLNENKRSALHELFSGQLNDTDEYIMVIEQFCKKGFDIDCQDSLKRTPLHTAVENFLNDGIIALLACGADLNMTDCNKCTPFSMLITDIDDIDLGKLSDGVKERILIMARHVRKMQAFKLKVAHQNALLESKYTEICDGKSSDDDAERLQLDELKKMKEVVLEENLTLHDVMYMESFQLVSQVLIDELRPVLSREDFHTTFPELGGILKLKLRIAQRKKAISSARKSLYFILRMRIPETCTDIIASCLSDWDLKTLADMVAK